MVERQISKLICLCTKPNGVVPTLSMNNYWEQQCGGVPWFDSVLKHGIFIFRKKRVQPIHSNFVFPLSTSPKKACETCLLRTQKCLEKIICVLFKSTLSSATSNCTGLQRWRSQNGTLYMVIWWTIFNLIFTEFLYILWIKNMSLEFDKFSSIIKLVRQVHLQDVFKTLKKFWN